MRYRVLCRIGRADLSIARLVEAHSDALAILAEAGHSVRQDALYGVWASDGPKGQLRAVLVNGLWHLNGVKQFCSGAPFVTAALVTARARDGLLLFDVPLDAHGIKVGAPCSANLALVETGTTSVEFDNVAIAGACSVGSPDWYLSRPGFWHGAIGPAACWAGGALSLIDGARGVNRRDPHSRAQLGALEAAAWSFATWLDAAGREIDQDPADRHHNARRRALIVRHLIERTCVEVLDRFGRATGPQLLAFNCQIARQHSALSLYIRQCHAERDLEVINS